MSEYECPECRGGFPDPDRGACPWCGTALDKSHDAETEHIVRRTSANNGADDAEDQRSPVEQILGFGGDGR